METEKPNSGGSPVLEALPQNVVPPAVPQPARKKKPLTAIIGLVVVIAIVALALKWRGTTPETGAESIPTVAVTKVTRGNFFNEVPIPAEFRAYVESELHAMVTGYVSQMNVDFGDKVKKGEVLAVLEVPELVDELHSAQAREKQAQADYADAHLIYNRLVEVNKQHQNLVAQQDIDTAESKDTETAAALAAATADVEKFQTLLAYTQIIAPFDGVVTQRSVDPGALVQAGTSSDRSMPLLRISDNYLLRLDFPVSVDYVKYVQMGDLVTVRVDSLGGKTFTGKITRFTNRVSDDTRTMITELEVQNPNLEIVPGMYAVALFKFKEESGALSIPVEAISNPKTPVVHVVNAQNEIEERPVALGVEMPNRYEVTSGLRAGEMVVLGDATQIHPGQKVEPKLVDAPSYDSSGDGK